MRVGLDLDPISTRFVHNKKTNRCVVFSQGNAAPNLPAYSIVAVMVAEMLVAVVVAVALVAVAVVTVAAARSGSGAGAQKIASP